MADPHAGAEGVYNLLLFLENVKAFLKLRDDLVLKQCGHGGKRLGQGIGHRAGHVHRDAQSDLIYT